MERRRSYIFVVAAWLTLLVAWQILSLCIGNIYIFPTVPQLFSAILGLFSEVSFINAVLSTLIRGIAGMILALCFALMLAWPASRSEGFRIYLHPFLTLFRSVPVISFLFLFLIWFSPGHIPLVMALITMTPVLTENLIEGFMRVDTSLLEMSHMYSFSLGQKIKHVIYPAVSPFLFSGLISATGLGWKAIVMGEALAQPDTGIGVMIRESHGFVEIPRLLAWTLVAVFISYCFEIFLRKAGTYRFPVSFAMKDRQKKELKPFPEIIPIEGMTKRFGEKVVLSGLQMTVPGEKITCLMAPSGYGKTTLLRLLSGLEHTESGDKSLKKKYDMAFLFQEYRLLPHLTVWENITLPQSSYVSRNTARRQAFEILEQMSMENCMDCCLETLSGGECQRVALARMMLFPASLYLLDEPFKGLDFELKQKVMEIFREWQRRFRKTVLYVTHQDDETRIADKIVKIE